MNRFYEVTYTTCLHLDDQDGTESSASMITWAAGEDEACHKVTEALAGWAPHLAITSMDAVACDGPPPAVVAEDPVTAILDELEAVTVCASADPVKVAGMFADLRAAIREQGGR